MEGEYRLYGRLTALCLAAGLLTAGCQNQQQLVHTQSPPAHSCYAPPGFSDAVAEPVPYRAPTAGLRLASENGYLEITSVDPDHTVTTINPGGQTFRWAEGLFGLRKTDIVDKPEALSQALWPLTIGKVVTFSEHSPDRSINHTVTVKSFDTFTFGGKPLPVVWIDDHNMSETAIGGDYDSTYSLAYAPSLGFIVAINARGNGASKAPGVGWIMHDVVPCDRPAQPPILTVDALRDKAKAGDVDAMIELGKRLSEGRGVEKDPTVAAALYEKAANSGNAEAEALTGECYLSGFGVTKKPETAIVWLQKAADQNYPRAQQELAASLHSGVGIARDDNRAFKLALAAAEHGDVNAMATVGTYYALGVGTSTDQKLAKEWLLKAADQRDLVAAAVLGRFYRDGTFGSADLFAAYSWLDIAIGRARGDRDRNALTTARDDLALILPADDIERAQAMALHWRMGLDFAGKGSKASVAAQKAADAPASANPASAAPSAKPETQEHPVVQKLLTTDITVAPDASSVLVYHSEMFALNQSAANQLAQIPVTYRELIDEMEITEAYTLKKDGRKLPVDLSAIYPQLIPGTPTVPMFDDQKQKVIVFPNVEAGDVVVYTAQYKTKPIIPGMFSISRSFPRSFPFNEMRLTVTTPKSLPLTTETHEVQFNSHAAGDNLVYEWRYANTAPISEDVIALDAFERFPRFFASTLPDHKALGVAYGKLIKSKADAGEKIKALANQITDGAADHRQQAERIYRWVGEHIRYVGVELGNGGYVPHDAQTVLDNGYGDCKDHTILFSALLAAKGIKSDVVLINATNNYALAAPPTLSNFNHAISWLPEFGMYADTTAAVAPFGVLPWSEYGKEVVHVGSDGEGVSVRKVPLLAPGVASYRLKTTAKLAADGTVTGDSALSATGPYAIGLREAMIYIEKTGTSEAARAYLKETGIEGSGQFDAVSPHDPAANSIRGHFDLNPIEQRVNGSSFAIPTGYEMFGSPGGGLMGPKALLRLSSVEPTPCFSGSEVEDISLELPKGKHLREVPPRKEIKTDNLIYRSEWSYSDHTVRLRREFSSTIDAPVCVGKVRADTAKALNEIRGDSHTSIAVVSD